MRLLTALAAAAAVSLKAAEGKLTVHLVPHTHDDVGWLKTVDQYYTGADSDIQNANVQLILDAVTAELARNPARKFTYVEIGFFERWWRNRPQFHDLVKGFVASGQLTFVNGGYSMHDEANPSFVDMVDNTAVGHRFLLETFGVTPKTTWQIDPFGHSGFQGSMMSSAQSGFHAVHWARDDWQEFAQRSANKSNELFWFPSPSQGRNAGTFASSLFYYYYPPPGFNWCYGSSDDPIQDDPMLEGYNVQSRVNDFITLVMQQANATQGNDLIWTMGCDFAYDNAAYWYGNLDKLIQYVNADGRVNAMYSNPDIYSAAKIGSISFPLKSEDYMPLIDTNGHGVWSGYFTSRPALKGYIRETGSYQQYARQMQLFTGGVETSADDPSQPLYLLERSQAINQHHDAVSGTSKQAVAYDYALRLASARLITDGFLSTAYGQLTGDADAQFLSCDLANVTICPALEPLASGKSVMLALYNQQAQDGEFLIRLPVPAVDAIPSFAVFGPDGSPVAAQLLPASPADIYLRDSYYNYTVSSPVGDNIQWLAFIAKLPPAGFAMHFIVPVSSASNAPNTFPSTITEMNIGQDEDQQVTNGIVNITISGANGLATSFWTADVGTVSFSQSFAWYNSSAGIRGKGYPNTQASGAYIFRPNSSNIYQVNDLKATVFNKNGKPLAWAPPVPGLSSAMAVTIVSGGIVTEARQIFSSWVSQVIRVYQGSTHADFEHTVGAVPFQDGLGREVVSRYSLPNWSTQGTFATDSNCRDTQVRIKGFRRAFNFTAIEPVASNYFPVNCLASIRDSKSSLVLNVVTDRSQGGSSMNNGQLEIMPHRRLLHDDNRGVGEPLNETGLDGNGLIIRGVHRVSINLPSDAGDERRQNIADTLFKPFWLAGLLTTSSPQSWISAYKASFSGVTKALPANVHLLTAQSLKPGQMLLRLSHSFEVGESPINSGNVTVALADLFSTVSLKECVEMTLTGNQPLASAPKVTYQLQDGTSVSLPVIPNEPTGPSMSVTLTPMSIRTFMCNTA